MSLFDYIYGGDELNEEILEDVCEDGCEDCVCEDSPEEHNDDGGNTIVFDRTHCGGG